MAVPTAAEFLVQFPEFLGAPEALVDAKLAFAGERTDAAVWGTLHTQGVMQRAADLLAKSPFAREMRLVVDGKSVYEDDLKAMIRRVAVGVRVFDTDYPHPAITTGGS